MQEPAADPGRRSESACESIVTSAPVASQTSAIALMNEILVARNALAATFTSSAVAKSVTTNGTPGVRSVAVDLAQDLLAAPLASATPTTSRSGRRVSSTAKPSRRNSGFQASSTPSPAARSALSRLRAAQRCRPARSTCRRRAQAGRRCGSSVVDRRVDVRQVGGVLALLLRRAHADEVHVAERGRLGVGGGEPQPAGRECRAQQLGEAGLEERQPPVGELVDLGLVDVQAEDLVAQLGHAGGVRGTEIAGAEHGDARRSRHLPADRAASPAALASASDGPVASPSRRIPATTGRRARDCSASPCGPSPRTRSRRGPPRSTRPAEFPWDVHEALEAADLHAMHVPRSTAAPVPTRSRTASSSRRSPGCAHRRR